MRFLSLFLVFFVPLLSSSVPFRQSPSLASTSSSPSPSFATKITLPGIRNAGKVSDSLFRGAQPHLSNLVELKKLGIVTIVDLRSESPHTRDEERAHAHSLGIHFVSIPVGGFSTPTSTQLAEFFALFRQTPAQKIFVHCQFGEDRTGVLVAAYRIAFDHWSSDQALSEMQAFGFHPFWHPSMVTFVRTLPDRLHSDPVLKSALAD
jgi:protein tyrosine/serine phosphatase